MAITTDEKQLRAAGTSARRRLTAGLVAALVTGIDLSAKAWAVAQLQDEVVGLGVVDLRLAYNSGVAFSVGAGAPGWLVLTATALVTLGVGVLAWRTAASGPGSRLIAFALVLGGAIANLADRAVDGVVTDYLHTGWFPTFNLADIAIVTGAGLLVLLAATGRGAAGTEPERE
ncbi:signal peptidase II [Actinotalea solisilvae]|uniref:signal peptidase II n=1 Tax=Actinotalea solisilvae TaxID=2072922 RepID=UPI0018F10B76|nr:signal peptidase II [Actinotalea solisilvae]